MSSTKSKKEVHYERGTKGPSHRSHNSRDSGVGSSSSDRATVHDDEKISHQQDIDDQRYNLRAVQEALLSAKDHIKHLEATIRNLHADLSESNKENRTLKNEKGGLLSENQDLLEVIEDLNKKLKKRESSPRSSIAKSSTSAKPERRPSLSIRPGGPSPRSQTQVFPEERQRPLPDHSEKRPFIRQTQTCTEECERPPLSDHTEKRPSIRQTQSRGPPPSPRLQVYTDPHPQPERRLSSAMYERTAPLPTAPQPPVNHHANPFAPRSVNSPVVSYAAIPANVSYGPSNISYVSQQPIYATSHGSVSVSGSSSSGERKERREKRTVVDDGKYHLKPL